MSFGKPKAPKPTAEQKALEKDQIVQMSQLNQQENERRKRLLAAQQGIRAYTGSALFRAAPGDRAGGPAVAPPAGGVGGVNAGYSSYGLNSSLLRGALVR